MLTLLLSLSMGCPPTTNVGLDPEGYEPGDCMDGADNDSDGAFDCADEGCAGTPDCPGGCGAEVSCACEAYFDALNVCYEAYGEAVGVDMTGSLLEAEYCEDTYGDMLDLASAQYLLCLADAYNAVDCGDPDQYAAVDVSGCSID